MTNITFAGHREIYDTKLIVKIENIIREFLKSDTAFRFYTGGMGNFDDICSQVVRKIKKEYPNVDIELILVIPYFTDTLNKYNVLYNKLYDSIIYPEELINCHYKSAIQKRNRWIVEKSDIVLSYVHFSYGGAYKTVKYAEKLKKKIISFA